MVGRCDTMSNSQWLFYREWLIWFPIDSLRLNTSYLDIITQPHYLCCMVIMHCLLNWWHMLAHTSESGVICRQGLLQWGRDVTVMISVSLVVYMSLWWFLPAMQWRCNLDMSAVTWVISLTYCDIVLWCRRCERYLWNCIVILRRLIQYDRYMASLNHYSDINVLFWCTCRYRVVISVMHYYDI